MDTDTILENRLSQKNQTSKRRNLLHICLISVVLVVTAEFTSCDKEVDNYSEDDDNYLAPTPYNGGISGTIVGNYAEWDVVGLAFGEQFVMETPIINGKFTFSSLPTPKPENLEPFVENEELLQYNKDVKICLLSFMAIKGSLESSYDGRGIGQIITTPNSFTWVHYMYADHNFKIKSLYSTIEAGIKRTFVINLNIKQGWNTVFYEVSNLEKDSITITYKNGAPSSETVWTGLF